MSANWYETTNGIEFAVANKFGTRINLIVPNVSWGLDIHECDLLIVSERGYVTEVEIKISKSDLKKDRSKRHCHNDNQNRIKRFYFAIPQKMEKDIDLIPDSAGIILVGENGRCRIIRESPINKKARQLTNEERFKVARLGTLRIWNLKEKIKSLSELIVS